MSRLPRLDAVLIQAVIAGALSFAHLHDIAAAAGQDGWKAWAYPISVDLLLVAAWRRIRTLQALHAPAGIAWCWFSIALAASLGANIATAGLMDLEAVPAWLRILVAGWPALAFFGGTLLAHTTPPEHPTEPLQVPTDHTELTPAPTVEPEPEPAAATTPELEVESEPVALLEPEPEPAPAPAGTESPSSLPSVPSALVEHARKLADTHHRQTGEVIDTDTLRARLGVPAPMADAIATQLA